jgi:hypothetical protein
VANKRVLITLVLAGVAIMAMGVLTFRCKEPMWHGRSLSAWLNDFDADKMEKRELAAQALRQIGSNAVPFLIPRLPYPKYAPISQWSGLKTRILFLLSKQHFIKVSPPQPTSPRHQALAAIDALGPAAECALPALEKLLHETPPDPRAPYIFARIGPAGVPFLNQALTNNERAIQMGARACLDALNSPSDPLFPPPGEVPSNYDRRCCEYNLRILKAAFVEYKRQHPEMDSPNNFTDTPPPRLPPDFTPVQAPQPRQSK